MLAGGMGGNVLFPVGIGELGDNVLFDGGDGEVLDILNSFKFRIIVTIHMCF